MHIYNYVNRLSFIVNGEDYQINKFVAVLIHNIIILLNPFEDILTYLLYNKGYLVFSTKQQ